MSEETNTAENTKAEEQPPSKESIPYHEQVEEYGGGHIQARHGRINGWLLVVYYGLFVWALYYGYTYWGGLGPGLDY
jgi:hypothetical protein